ncbi:MAG: hypothetical protein FJW34_05110 [Acidobacteria bacterium]|nr:hypothetical protein [Acidobacteriota bacterium]
MKRFSFRLQNVLKWRLLQLELAEEKLQELFSEARNLEARQISLAESKAAAEGSVLTARTVAGQELAALEAYRRWTAAQQERLARQLLDCQGRIAAQREQVRKAEQNLKLLEKLRERRLAEWTFALEKEYEALGEEAFLAQWQRA